MSDALSISLRLSAFAEAFLPFFASPSNPEAELVAQWIRTSNSRNRAGGFDVAFSVFQIEVVVQLHPSLKQCNMARFE